MKSYPLKAYGELAAGIRQELFSAEALEARISES